VVTRDEFVDLGSSSRRLCFGNIFLMAELPFTGVKGDAVRPEEIARLFVWLIDIRLDLVSLEF
jgi:hypothetical protein